MARLPAQAGSDAHSRERKHTRLESVHQIRQTPGLSRTVHDAQRQRHLDRAIQDSRLLRQSRDDYAASRQDVCRNVFLRTGGPRRHLAVDEQAAGRRCERVVHAAHSSGGGQGAGVPHDHLYGSEVLGGAGRPAIPDRPQFEQPRSRPHEAPEHFASRPALPEDRSGVSQFRLRLVPAKSRRSAKTRAQTRSNGCLRCAAWRFRFSPCSPLWR